MAEDKSVAVVLVDPQGDGTDLIVTGWRLSHSVWFQEDTLGSGKLRSVATGYWADGAMGWAVGRSTPTKAALVRYRGKHQVCRGSEFGFWAFARKADDSDNSERPEQVA